jgi:hypothetical protein
MMTRYFTTGWLVASQGHTYGPWLNGLVPTRRGRAALANGTVGQILDRVYAPSP